MLQTLKKCRFKTEKIEDFTELYRLTLVYPKSTLSENGGTESLLVFERLIIMMLISDQNIPFPNKLWFVNL